MYPHGEPSVRVRGGRAGTRWEGASRPGHFDGVLTVVMLLLHLVRPDVAVFGRKDRQQLALVAAHGATTSRWAWRCVAGPTVREADGLARSSRNAYLDAAARADAAALPARGRGGPARRPARAPPRPTCWPRPATRSPRPGCETDYCAARRPGRPARGAATTTPGPAVLLLAARVGGTRLIDNTDLDLAAR